MDSSEDRNDEEEVEASSAIMGAKKLVMLGSMLRNKVKGVIHYWV